MVTVNNVSVSLQNKTILDQVSCTLLPGRITLFIGQSGAGKTTLLKTVAGLLPVKAGQIRIDDTDLCTLSASERALQVGYVFQDFNLFPHMSLLQNCIDPLTMRGIAYEVACQQVRQILAELQMCDYLERYPHELSGGQKQRVAIARCLSLNSQVLLFDEPTASLDPVNCAILSSVLKRLAKKGLTIGISTQDMHFAQALFDRVYLLQNGKIIEFCDEIGQLKRCRNISNFI